MSSQHNWSFSLVTLLLIFVPLAFAMLGGMLGVASASQETVTELSSANRSFGIVGGLVFGMVPAVVIGGVLHRVYRKPIVTFFASVCTALFFSTVALYVIAGILAAA